MYENFSRLLRARRLRNVIFACYIHEFQRYSAYPGDSRPFFFLSKKRSLTFSSIVEKLDWIWSLFTTQRSLLHPNTGVLEHIDNIFHITLNYALLWTFSLIARFLHKSTSFCRALVLLHIETMRERIIMRWKRNVWKSSTLDIMIDWGEGWLDLKKFKSQTPSACTTISKRKG